MSASVPGSVLREIRRMEKALDHKESKRKIWKALPGLSAKVMGALRARLTKDIFTPSPLLKHLGKIGRKKGRISVPLTYRQHTATIRYPEDMIS